MLKLFRHYILAQAQFHKAGPAKEKALDPVLVFIRWPTHRFEIVV